MRVSRRSAVALGAAVVAATALVAPGTAEASTTKHQALGTKPLSDTAAAFAGSFDAEWNNFNIVSHAVFAVIKAKPDSPVGLLAKGDVALTAFLPTDRAFQSLVFQLTGKTVNSEADVFGAVAGLGIDTVEQVLLYHVVPGATLNATKVLGLRYAEFTTAQGQEVAIKVRHGKKPVIKVIDGTEGNPVAQVNLDQVDINAGNKQIAHGISQVLLPDSDTE